ncbi:MAG: hypothetical protein ACR2RV_01355 [Verrucomicrobiales bacterium]
MFELIELLCDARSPSRTAASTGTGRWTSWRAGGAVENTNGLLRQ